VTTFAPGTLVRTREREWVVLPESEEDLLVLRPLGGTDEEVAGVFPALEGVEPATWALPDPENPGDFRSCRMLRDALRLGFRSSAGPFRSLARIAVEPRPYQLVPLLMALKLDPVRLLIADDVGIGKTIEAALVARELLDRGEARRLAVLCPPHLAEQWQRELARFHLPAELVLSSTVRRLEARCSLGQSLFEVYPYVVVSTDFIKSDRHRQDFLRACPELVIVDEAHGCAASSERGSGRHQRHELLRGLAADRERHLLLVTATPHSGKEEAFRSLLTLLDPAFADLPENLAGEENQRHRRRLAAHLVQRRRGDLTHFLGDTPFPVRESSEATWRLSDPYRKLFEQAIAYAREAVEVPGEARVRQRIRWWGALALLRAIGSSPAAAAATLRTRAAGVDAASAEEADEAGRAAVLDLSAEEGAALSDVLPGADAETPAEGETAGGDVRRRLLALARAAEALVGDGDPKLAAFVPALKKVLDEGFKPIVFCRFIETAESLARELRSRLPKRTTVEAVTGLLSPEDREQRVLALARAELPVLVATDCLSEGINLQDHFSAVLHYDLAWNPTRHEQREGRVDRYGQPEKGVRVVTFHGADNPIDGLVLDVLLRKHQRIRSALGISVPVPVDSDAVLEAVVEGLLLRRRGADEQLALFSDAEIRPRAAGLHEAWDAQAEREKRSRTLFAQHGIQVEEVARELESIRSAIGSAEVVRRFTLGAWRDHGGTVAEGEAVELARGGAPRALLEAAGAGAQPIRARFELPVGEREVHLHRTHPLVEGLASYVLESALDPQGAGHEPAARRAGVLRTAAVSRRTTLALLRLRFHLLSGAAGEAPMLVEDARVAAFAGPAEAPEWLPGEEAERLAEEATPAGNVPPDVAREQLRRAAAEVERLRPALDEIARARAAALHAAHVRVREAAKRRTAGVRVEPQLPADVLGLYVLLPVPRAGGGG